MANRTKTAEIPEALNSLGVRCRDKLINGDAAIKAGNATIVEAARIVVEVHLRIKNGEAYDGGFVAWWKSYCTGTGSPWTLTKLLTAGGWREAKKTGVVAAPAVVEAKVVQLKTADARRKKVARKNNRTSEKSAPHVAAIDRPTSTFEQVRDGALCLSVPDKQKLIVEMLGFMDAGSCAIVHERTVVLALEQGWTLDCPATVANAAD